MNIPIVYPEQLFLASTSVVQMKYCENCGSTFARPFAHTTVRETFTAEITTMLGVITKTWSLRKDHGERFCADCKGRQLQPDILGAEAYVDMMPGTRRQLGRRLASVPKYDDSVSGGNETSSHRVSILPQPVRQRLPRAQQLERAARMKLKVTEAFRQRGRLTTEDLQQLLDECYSLAEVLPRMQGLNLRMRMVDRVRRTGVLGAGFGVYVLDGVSPETLIH